VKYGPSVSATVVLAVVLPPLHARLGSMLVAGLPVAVAAVSFESGLLVVVGAITSGLVLPTAVGEVVLSELFEVAAVGEALMQAARAITLIAITILKIVFRFIFLLH